MKRFLPVQSMMTLLALTLAIALHVADVGAQHGSVTLQAKSTVEGGAIQLRQVARLDAAVDGVYGGVVVGRFNGSETSVRVGIDDVRKALTAANANFGKLSLGGFATCEVSRKQDTAVEPLQPLPALEERNTGARSAIVANPASELDVTKPISLRDHVVLRLAQQVGVSPTELRITFTQNDLKELDKVRGGRFELEMQSSTGLGRVPVLIRWWRDGQQVETLRVAAEVSRRVLALVAVGDLRRDQTIQASDVEIREIFVDSATIRPITSSAEAVGQTVSTTLRAGDTIDARYLEQPILVQKNQLITVQTLVGDMVLRTTVRAQEDGQRDAIIAVRNERSRETFHVRVIGTRLAEIAKPAVTDAAADSGHERLGGSQ